MRQSGKFAAPYGRARSGQIWGGNDLDTYADDPAEVAEYSAAAANDPL